MSAMLKLRPSALASSELDIRREMADLEDDADVLAVLESWDGRSLVVDRERGQRVWHGLVYLANLCDEIALDSRTSIEERRANRAACTGLTTLHCKIGRWLDA